MEPAHNPQRRGGSNKLEGGSFKFVTPAPQHEGKMTQLSKVKQKIHQHKVWLWVWLFVFFRLHDLSMLVYVLFYLGQLSHFPSCCGAGVTNLNEPPSSLLLPRRYCGLGAGSIPLRAIVNKTQCETRGLFMSLVIYYWIGDVQDSQGAIILPISILSCAYCVLHISIV